MEHGDKFRTKVKVDATKKAAAWLVLLAGIAISNSVFAAPENRPLPTGCALAQRPAPAEAPGADLRSTFPPVQLDIRTPFEPSAFSAGGYRYLVYELLLLNHSEDAVKINGLDVLAPSANGESVLFSLSGVSMQKQLSLIGGGGLDAEHPLAAGRSATAYLCLAFQKGTEVPSRLRHRVLLDSAIAEGPVIGTAAGRVKVLSSPVRGSHWLADNALALDRHHRPGLFVAGGSAQISRRYAIDWKQRIDGDVQSGDAADVRTYHAYAKPVFAVADATVVRAKDGFPDNVPRTAAGFSPAVPLSMETLAGNTVVLDLGDGQFAHYAHLQPGSVAVRVGQRVRRGAQLARIGNSGDARWPHLHFQVSTGPDIMNSEGVPFVIDRFRATDGSGGISTRSLEFPLSGDELTF
ncbi:M23 family metallopeptidase [Pseudomonas sp. CGJS7]|uniref:M23 family metallopeptidase n=1 Tax=Pseudomonas sp. CGJS7 TaxID=3109348 RepID=UPI003009EA97